MNKTEHISYWIDTANDDWKISQKLFKSKDYLYALFFAHLVLEKLCKAHWVKDNKENYPPKIHNLNKLVAQSKLELAEEELIFLADFNKFQLEGRYKDYITENRVKINSIIATNYNKQCKQLRKKLLALLPSE